LTRVLEDFVIPAGRGRAILVPRGAVLRIHLVEDRQVGDCCFFNANDRKEVFHVGQSWALNVLLGTGNARSFKHFYSKPPRENVMLTVLEDTVRNHWGNMGGRCSRRLYTLRADGSFAILAPTARKGDYIDLRAEMDVLAAVSACPADRNATNDGRAKPLGITVYSENKSMI